jgi:hypothetical protein
MKHVNQRILLIPSNVFRNKSIKNVALFYGELYSQLNKIDIDKNVKVCCEEISLTNGRITSLKNQSTKEFHESTLYRMENPNSHFLIFNN